MYNAVLLIATINFGTNIIMLCAATDSLEYTDSSSTSCRLGDKVAILPLSLIEFSLGGVDA